jgi:signal transduction histidine kinase
MIDRRIAKASWDDWWSFALEPRGPRLLQWAWTVLFCTLIASGLTLTSAVLRGGASLAFLLPFFRDHLIVSMTIGLTIHGLSDVSIALIGVRRLRRLATGGLVAFWCIVALFGVLIGWPLGMDFAGRDVIEFGQAHPQALRASIVFSVLLMLGIFVWISAVTRRTEAERRLGEAQLRLLQGQMEPHFLFNTLANVLSLMDTDVPRARDMLGAFIEYLRASLGQMRHERHTVAQELRLVRTYLELLRMRMGDRLRFDIDTTPDAGEAMLPPLLLQPLVENAIQHGLEPKIDGGHVRIEARVRDGHLLLQVRDNGQGSATAPPPGRPGSGLALANIRERLAARYGGGAALTIESTDAGTCATLQLPLEDEAACPPP